MTAQGTRIRHRIRAARVSKRSLTKRWLLPVAAVILFLAGGQTAWAQSCTAASSPTLVRSEGTLEVLGSIILNCDAGVSAIAVSITVALSPSTTGIAPAAAGAPCGAGGNNTSTFPLPTITTSHTGGFSVAPTCIVSGNVATFSFTPTAGTQTFTITGIRANIAASGLTAGAPATATLSVSPTVAGQLTITNPTLIVAFAFTSTFGTNTAKINSCAPVIPTPVGTPSSVSANPDPSPVAANSLKVTVTEGFPTALQAAATEDGGSGFGRGTRLRIQLTGIPSGITIYAPRAITSASAGTDTSSTGSVTPDAPTTVTLQRVGTTGTPVNADGSGGSINGLVLNQFDRISQTSGTATIVYEVTAAELTPVTNTITIFIAVTGTAPTGTGTISGSVGFAPVGPPTTAASRPQFAPRSAVTVADVLLCATYLLFPFVANTGDGNFDTGIAITNTALDPAIIGTAGSAGDVTLYFFRRGGGANPTNPAPVTIATGLQPGDMATVVVSSLLGEPFIGYVFAVCNFQFAHGFAFINNPLPGSGGSFSEVYLPLVVNNPRLGGFPPPTEMLGH